MIGIGSLANVVVGGDPLVSDSTMVEVEKLVEDNNSCNGVLNQVCHWLTWLFPLLLVALLVALFCSPIPVGMGLLMDYL